MTARYQLCSFTAPARLLFSGDERALGDIRRAVGINDFTLVIDECPACAKTHRFGLAETQNALDAPAITVTCPVRYYAIQLEMPPHCYTLVKQRRPAILATIQAEKAARRKREYEEFQRKQRPRIEALKNHPLVAEAYRQRKATKQSNQHRAATEQAAKQAAKDAVLERALQYLTGPEAVALRRELELRKRARR